MGSDVKQSARARTELALDERLSPILPRKKRTFLEFAEQELVLASGPRKGLRFRASWQPWVAHVIQAFDDPKWREYWAEGSTQSGKTLLFVVLPILYHLFELEQDVIFGAPTLELGTGAFLDKVLPSILASRYAGLLPVTGLGSRGGTTRTYWKFRHGPWLRVIGAQGSDAQKSSHTAPIVVMTEVDKMDLPSATSREGSPVDQFRARTGAYSSSGRARIYGECTPSIPEGRIVHEVEHRGSCHRILIPCPHCSTWQEPQREQLVGWQDARTEVQAREQAALACTECGGILGEPERRAALRNVRVVGRGQSVIDGEVVGELEAGVSYGVRWNACHSAFLDLADVAQAEYEADRLDDGYSLRRVLQFFWGRPLAEEDIDRPEELVGVTREICLRKVGEQPRGQVIEGWTCTVGVDVRATEMHWVACCWGEGLAGSVVSYGVEPVNSLDRPGMRNALERSLAAAPAEAKLALVDSGYSTREIYAACMDLDSPDRRVLPAKGGSSDGPNARTYVQPKHGAQGIMQGDGWYARRAPSPGRPWLIHVDTSRWKRDVLSALGAPLEARDRSLKLHWVAKPREHAEFAKHCTAERQERVVGKRGESIAWVAKRSANHYLDALYLSRAGRAVLGRAAPKRKQVNPRMQARQRALAREQSRGKIRAKY